MQQRPVSSLAQALGAVAVLVLHVVFANHAMAGDETRTIFVPANVIYPGDEITPESLRTLEIKRPQDSDAAFGERQEDLVGKVARRTLVSGQPIPASALRSRDVITQGRTYKLIYHSPFVTVVGSGVPLQSASAGAMVNVRNPDTGIIVKARVTADQTLVIDEQ